MKELAKAAISLTWAMSLFGMEQVSHALYRNDIESEGPESHSAIDHVAGAAREELGGQFHQMFKFSDRMQREIVDMMANWGRNARFDPLQGGTAWAERVSPPHFRNHRDASAAKTGSGRTHRRRHSERSRRNPTRTSATGKLHIGVLQRHGVMWYPGNHRQQIAARLRELFRGARAQCKSCHAQ